VVAWDSRYWGVCFAGQHHWVFALVNLILTKRQARCGRVKSAKNSAKAAKNGANRLWGRTLFRDNTRAGHVTLAFFYFVRLFNTIPPFFRDFNLFFVFNTIPPILGE
jgi:hypothetical protein